VQRKLCGHPKPELEASFTEAGIQTKEEREITMTIHEKYKNLLQEIDERGWDLTSWEIKFISDLIDTKPNPFSYDQQQKIAQIHGRRVS